MRGWLAPLLCLATAACATTQSDLFSRFRAPSHPAPLLAQTRLDTNLASSLANSVNSFSANDSKESLARQTPDPASIAAASAERLDLALRLMAQSDKTCFQYLDSISVAQRTWRSTFSVLGTAFGIAGSVATPARSKGVLSALAGGMGGLRGNLDEGILANQTSYLVRVANVSLRTRLRIGMLESIQTGYLKDASASTIASEIEANYHSQCGIDVGLHELGEALKRPAPVEATRAPAAKAPGGA